MKDQGEGRNDAASAHVSSRVVFFGGGGGGGGVGSAFLLRVEGLFIGFRLWRVWEEDGSKLAAPAPTI